MAELLVQRLRNMAASLERLADVETKSRDADRVARVAVLRAWALTALDAAERLEAVPTVANYTTSRASDR